MKVVFGIFVILGFVGCGDGKLIDIRGEKGDTITGPQGLQGAAGSCPALVYVCHVPHGKHGQEYNLFVPQNQVSNFLTVHDYLGECQ